MNNFSFEDLTKNGRIRIPQIQRDYAQGRRNKMVDEIRENFVRSLLLVVMGKKSEAQLDFVYGSEREEAFEPLDGQQRLTTLFLLHWVLGSDLCNEKGESILTYETRNSSKAFCNELITHNAKQFVDEAKKKSKNNNQEYTPSEIIRQRDWFQWGWQFDPTISSMLVMIDTICKQMDWSLDINECKERLQNITFNYLDLGELGMSDELFIKMNARGKLLSDFDKLKSTLEEEIQQQQEEQDVNGIKLANAEIEKYWRGCMDGKWIDLFWQKYSKDIMNDEPSGQLKVAKETEKRFRIFLLRMIAMQIFAEMANVEKSIKVDEDNKISIDFNRLYDAAYKNNEVDLDDFLLAYQNQLTDWRSNLEDRTKPDYCFTIDYAKLIEFINLWIIEQGYNQYTDVTSLLSQDTSFSPFGPSYFDLFIGDKISNDVTAIIYAIQLFLKDFPYKKDSTEWRSNFEEWTRIARNVFNNDNNTDKFNKRKDLADAFVGIKTLVFDMKQYFSQNNLDVYSDDSAVISFVKNIGNLNNYLRVDNQSLQEEIDKAKLRLSEGKINKDWTKAIRGAENTPYLWGQIRCIIHWSSGNLQKFNAYADHLSKCINTGEIDKIQLYYTAMLCLQPDCWKSSNRLYEFNKDRDNSIKRYLRDAPDYGYSIKVFIDKWIEWNGQASFQDFCIHVIQTAKPTGWIKYFLEYPEIIWEAWRKRIFEEEGHVIFAQQKTTDSHCFDPVFLYLEKYVEKKFSDNKQKGVSVKSYDSKSEGSYGLEIITSSKTYNVSWAVKSSEYILNDGISDTQYNLEGLVETIKSEIDKI